MTEQEIKEYAETLYPPQKGKHWVRTLRNAKVEAFVKGALWNEMKGLKISSNAMLAAVPDVDTGHGKCKEKNCEKWATVDYNGHGHWVCKGHYESLSNYFDEEYR